MVTYWPTWKLWAAVVTIVTTLPDCVAPLDPDAAIVATLPPDSVNPAPLNDTVGVAAPLALTAMFWNVIDTAFKLVPFTTGLYQFVIALFIALMADWMLPTSVAEVELHEMLPVVAPLMVNVKVPPVIAAGFGKAIVCTSFIDDS